MSNDAMTSKKLIESVENRSHVPVNQSTFTAQKFLDFATEELRLSLIPFILSMNEDYMLYEIEVDMEEGKKEYTIPSRGTGVKLKDLQVKDSNGNYREMTRISIGERFTDDYGDYYYNLSRFYIKNNKVVLLGNPQPGYKLVFIVYIKPSTLVTEDRVGIISGINTTNNTIVVDQIPEVFTTSEKYDLYKASSPYNVLKIDFNIVSLNVTTNSITLSEIPDGLEIGDHISLANESIIPQVPEELHVMLAQMVTCRVMESQGDTEGLRNAMAKLQSMKDEGGLIIDNRVTDAPRKVKNRHGFLRNPFGRYNYRG
jgi:hypothetical protein